jgi:hypothetical protein
MNCRTRDLHAMLILLHHSLINENNCFYSSDSINKWLINGFLIGQCLNSVFVDINNFLWTLNTIADIRVLTIDCHRSSNEHVQSLVSYFCRLSSHRWQYCLANRIVCELTASYSILLLLTIAMHRQKINYDIKMHLVFGKLIQELFLTHLCRFWYASYDEHHSIRRKKRKMWHHRHVEMHFISLMVKHKANGWIENESRLFVVFSCASV